MFTKPLRAFTEWLDSLTDAMARGGRGEDQALRRCVSELRIHIGAGWRVYFTQRGGQQLPLAGGPKGTQKRDIKRAKALAALLD